MKIAYCIRQNWRTVPGGDVVQMLNTKSELERNFDIEIRIIDDYRKISDYKPDIAHIFNMQTLDESSVYLEEAKSQHSKVVLSTIYWDLSHARFIVNMAKLNIYASGEYFKKLYNIYRGFEIIMGGTIGVPASSSKQFKDRMKKFLKNCDYFLPNSEEEMEIVNKVFNDDFKNFSVVPNALDIHKFPFFNSYNRKGFICAARFEPIKNQSMLVAVANELNADLTLIGAVTDLNRKYFDLIQKSIKSNNIKIINRNISQTDLALHFNNHKVHVLASFRESPGLSSLEALGSGMNIVVSDELYCPIYTYYKDLLNKHVFICDPYSHKSILNAMKKAHDLPAPRRNYIEKFNWENTANLTYEVYKKLYR